MKWASSVPLAKVVMRTSSPPTSWTSAPRSVVVVHTRKGSACASVELKSIAAHAIRNLRFRIFISCPSFFVKPSSITMRCVRSEEHFEHEPHRVRLVAIQVLGVVVVVLQPQPRELGRLPDEQGAD